MDTIQITGITADSLSQEIRGIVQSELESFKDSITPKDKGLDELMSRKEVSQYFKVDLSTIHNWTKKGRLKPKGIGHRVYFYRKDVELALKDI